MKSLAFIFSIIVGINFLTNNVASLRTERIMGGTSAAPNHNYTYQLSVHINSKHKCGAGIIDDKFAISTAHCVINITTGQYYPGLFTVVAGALNVSNSFELRFEDDVRKIYTHNTFYPIAPNRNGSYRSDGDIALLKLKTGFDLYNNRRLTKLVVSPHISYLHYLLTITGYGYSQVVTLTNPITNRHIEIGSNGGPLRFAQTKVIKHEDCIPFHEHYMSANHICAKMLQRRPGIPEGVCLGDSGGPLVYGRNILVGILISGPVGCNESKQPAIYLKVSYYSQFIQNALADKKAHDMRIATWKKKFTCPFQTKYEFVDE